MYCFAYGSNMSLARLRGRAPSVQFVAVATLVGHRLAFHKVSKDRSGKCDAQYTGSPEDKVIGVVFEVSESEKLSLDKAEGLGTGYDEKHVEVVTSERRTLDAQMYFATHIDPSLKPYHWYKKHVLVGAQENNLPPGYIAQIGAVESKNGPSDATS
ncbi:MAG: gamma-glutamylcyclotransferase family protein [Nitrospirales bacterium]